MPGRRTLKREAPKATNMKQVKRTQSADCQCKRAYGKRGQPITNCKRMKATAGQPRKSPSLPGMLQIFFQLVIAVLTQPCTAAHALKTARLAQPKNSFRLRWPDRHPPFGGSGRLPNSLELF